MKTILKKTKVSIHFFRWNITEFEYLPLKLRTHVKYFMMIGENNKKKLSRKVAEMWQQKCLFYFECDMAIDYEQPDGSLANSSKHQLKIQYLLKSAQQKRVCACTE